jgi:putative heme transporter
MRMVAGRWLRAALRVPDLLAAPMRRPSGSIMSAQVTPRVAGDLAERAAPRHRGPRRRLPRRRILRLVKITVSAALMAGLVLAELPRAAHAPWSDVGNAIQDLTLQQVVILCGVWILGIYAHSFVLTASLPQLTHRRAITLNLTGSAVSNLVPFGGAFGVGLNYAMSRAWGFSKPAFTVYTFVSNLALLLTKLSLPLLAVVALLFTDQVLHQQVMTLVAVALAAFVLFTAAVGASLCHEGVARFLGRGADRFVRMLLALLRSGRTVDLQRTILDLRRESLGLLRRGWLQLSMGMLTYSALQALLLWLSLHMIGSTLTVAQVLAGYAFERVLTLAAVTPGGAGLVEVGMAALLIAFGGAPVVTVAGVLIYRAFIFGLEMPVGGMVLLVWLCRRAVAGAEPVAAGREGPA